MGLIYYYQLSPLQDYILIKVRTTSIWFMTVSLVPNTRHAAVWECGALPFSKECSSIRCVGTLPAVPRPQLGSDPSWPSLQGSLVQALLSVIVLPRLNSITGLSWACKGSWVFPAVISTEGTQG